MVGPATLINIKWCKENQMCKRNVMKEIDDELKLTSTQ